MLSRGTAAIFTCLALVSSTPAPAQAPASLELVTETGTTTAILLDSLRRMPQVELRGQIHDGPALVFRGPALDAILALAGAPQGHDLRGQALRLVVLAEARDGYAVVYSLAELSPDLGSRRGIVAIEQDGQPLGEKDGRCASCSREKSVRRAGSASSNGSGSCGSRSRQQGQSGNNGIE